MSYVHTRCSNGHQYAQNWHVSIWPKTLQYCPIWLEFTDKSEFCRWRTRGKPLTLIFLRTTIRNNNLAYGIWIRIRRKEKQHTMKGNLRKVIIIAVAVVHFFILFWLEMFTRLARASIISLLQFAPWSLCLASSMFTIISIQIGQNWSHLYCYYHCLEFKYNHMHFLCSQRLCFSLIASKQKRIKDIMDSEQFISVMALQMNQRN